MGFTSLFLDPSDLSVFDFATSLYISVLLLAIRAVSEQIALPKLTAYLERIGGGNRKVAVRAYDDFFIALCSLVVETLALSAMLFRNYGCLPWNPEPCFANWPGQEFNDLQRWHYVVMFGYYLSEVLSTAMKKLKIANFGTILNMEMTIHHFVSMALISLSYTSGNLRFGVMWMALFDISNPILHLAKTFYPITRKDYEELSKNFFACFAMVFFVVRVLAGPYSILFTVGFLFKIAPLYYALTFNGLAYFVYGLQVLWFYKILQVAMGSGGGKKAKPEEKTE